jgi:hypothetical protein
VLVASWSQQHPTDGACLQALLNSAATAAESGEMEAALEQFRASIELICRSEKALRKGLRLAAAKGE